MARRCGAAMRGMGSATRRAAITSNLNFRMVFFPKGFKRLCSGPTANGSQAVNIAWKKSSETALLGARGLKDALPRNTGACDRVLAEHAVTHYARKKRNSCERHMLLLVCLWICAWEGPQGVFRPRKRSFPRHSSLLRVGKSHESVWARLLSFLRVRKASLKAASPFSFQMWYISRRKATCRGKTLF